METDTGCLPLLGRSGDVLSNALVELGRCGGHRPSHREGKKESGEVNHGVEVRYKGQAYSDTRSEHSSWSGGKKDLRVRQVPERVRYKAGLVGEVGVLTGSFYIC
jgi:hypothetical protein